MLVSVDTVDGSSSPSAFVGIGVDMLRAQAAAIVVRCLLCLPHGREQWIQQVNATELTVALLQDENTNVREHVLWSLKRALKLKPQALLQTYDVIRLQQVLVDRVCNGTGTELKEQNLICQRYTLQLLELFHSHSSTTFSLLPYYASFQQYAQQADASLRIAALNCIGICIRNAAEQATESLALTTMLQQWTALLVNCTADELPPAVRHAILTSVTLSRYFTSSLAQQHSAFSITIWKLLILLLQDESELIRYEASQLVSTALQQTQAWIDAVALQQSFAYLADTYWQAEEVVEYFLSLLQTPTTQYLTSFTHRTYAFKLFEKEKNNVGIEEVVLIEYAAKCKRTKCYSVEFERDLLSCRLIMVLCNSFFLFVCFVDLTVVLQKRLIGKWYTALFRKCI